MIDRDRQVDDVAAEQELLELVEHGPLQGVLRPVGSAASAGTVTTMRIAITGSSGLIGTALGAPSRPTATRSCRWCVGGRPGHRPLGHRRRAASTRPASRASTASCTSPARASPRSAGPTSRSARSARAARRAPRCSPRRWPRSTAKPPVLVSGSAIGFYGDRGDEQLTEAERARIGVPPRRRRGLGGRRRPGGGGRDPRRRASAPGSCSTPVAGCWGASLPWPSSACWASSARAGSG